MALRFYPPWGANSRLEYGADSSLPIEGSFTRVGRVTYVEFELPQLPIVIGATESPDTAEAAAICGPFRVGLVSWLAFEVTGSGVATGAAIAGTEASDTAAIVVELGAAGTIAGIETRDAAFLSSMPIRQGHVTWLNFELAIGSVSATIAATEGADSALLAGHPIITAQVAGTETTDAAAISGDATGIVNAQIAAVESSDTTYDSPRIDAVESPDVAAITAAATVGCSIVAAESPDVAGLLGDFPPVVAAGIAGIESTDTALVYTQCWMTAQIAAAEGVDVWALTGARVQPAGIAAVEDTDLARLVGDSNAPAETQPVGGIGKPHRVRRHRWFVEIDGREFEVSSEQEATDLLRRARDLARETATKAAEVATVGREEQAAPILPRIVASPALNPLIASLLAEIRADIEEIYRAAFYRAAHLEMLRRQQAQEMAIAQRLREDQDMQDALAAAMAADQHSLQALMELVTRLH